MFTSVDPTCSLIGKPKINRSLSLTVDARLINSSVNESCADEKNDMNSVPSFHCFYSVDPNERPRKNVPEISTVSLNDIDAKRNDEEEEKTRRNKS